MPTKTDEESLLRAAAKVFAERGYHAARVSDIVAAADVAQGTFYLYLSNKEEAFVRVVEHLADDLRALADLVDWSRITTVDELRDTLAAAYQAAFELLATRADEGRLLLRHAPAVSERAAAVRERFVRDYEQITRVVLDRSISAGLLRPFPSDLGASIIVGLLIQVIDRHVLDGAERRPPRRLARDLIDFELNGYAPG